MSKYAENTDVPVERSRGEIERTLTRYGASKFMYGWDQNKAIVRFEMSGRHIMFVLPLPDRNDKEFTHTPARKSRRTPEEATKAWEQACRQRWRCLSLTIKAKLEAVESGITDFSSEFLAHIILPNGKTVGQFMVPQIEVAYTSGKMPALLPEVAGQP